MLDGGPDYDWTQPLRGGPVDRGFDTWFGIPASLDIPPYYYVRDTYYKNPRFPLTGVNFTRDNYVYGPLEDWPSGRTVYTKGIRRAAG